MNTISVAHQKTVQDLIQSANSVLIGKEKEVKLALSVLLSDGHLLINDLPGVGKTTLANVLAKLCAFDFHRIQFTSDLLPADIIGVSVYDSESEKFKFKKGPVFSQLLLADEINRASAKTQSALMEAMEERQVSVEGVSIPLSPPFCVVATQNPADQAGTFPLPESQLDRFMLSISIGYPDPKSERQMLENGDPRQKLKSMPSVLNPDQLVELQQTVSNVHASSALIDYLQAIVSFTRNSPALVSGYSPRAAMTMLRVSKAWAFIHERNQVIPEDLQAIIPSTVHHLRARESHIDIAKEIIQSVAIP